MDDNRREIEILEEDNESFASSNLSENRKKNNPPIVRKNSKSMVIEKNKKNPLIPKKSNRAGSNNNLRVNRG